MLNNLSFISLALFASIIIMIVAIAHMPRCKPGDKGLYIGDIFIAGCQDRSMK